MTTAMSMAPMISIQRKGSSPAAAWCTSMNTTAPVWQAEPAMSRPPLPSRVPAHFTARFTRRTWSELLYALLGLPLGIAGFTFTVTTLSVSAGLLITFVGLPLVAGGWVTFGLTTLSTPPHAPGWAILASSFAGAALVRLWAIDRYSRRTREAVRRDA